MESHVFGPVPPRKEDLLSITLTVLGQTEKFVVYNDSRFGTVLSVATLESWKAATAENQLGLLDHHLNE